MANTVIGTATTTSRSWPARTPTASCSPARSRRASRPVAATSSTKKLYSADATNFTAEVNKVAAAKPDAIVLIAFDETKKIIPQLIAKGVGPQDVQIVLRRRQHRRLLEGLPEGHAQGRQGDLPGRRADLGLQGADAEDATRSSRTSPTVPSRTTRRSSPRWRRSRPRPTTRRRFAPDIIKVSKDGTSARASRTAPTCSRRARTSTTRVSPVRATSATPVARPRPPSASSSTAPTTSTRTSSTSPASSDPPQHERRGPTTEVGPLRCCDGVARAVDAGARVGAQCASWPRVPR